MIVTDRVADRKGTSVRAVQGSHSPFHMTLSHTSHGSCRLIMAAAALPAAGGAADASAQTAESAIHGAAIGAQSGAPIPFALMRLERAGADTTALARLVTDDAGRFRFGGLAAGDYRLRLERIGFEPTLSPALHVRDRDTLEYALRGSERMVTLGVVRVIADTSCLDGSRLSSDSTLTTLWSEARQGIEIRQAFRRLCNQSDDTLGWRRERVSALSRCRPDRRDALHPEYSARRFAVLDHGAVPRSP